MALEKINLATTSDDGLLDILLYDSNEFFYSLASSVKKRRDGNRYINVIGELDTCRESFMGELKSNLPKEKSTHKTNVMVTFPPHRAFSVRTRDDADIRRFKAHMASFERRIKTSLRIINIIEKKLGWPLSKVLRCKITPDEALRKKYSSWEMKDRKCNLEKDILPYIPVYLFVGSRTYRLSPQTMSLYLLLMRVPVISDFYKKVRSFKALMEAFEEHKNSNDVDTDPELMMEYRKWLPFLSNLKTLYKGRTVKKNFNAMAGARKGTDHYCGIDGLCSTGERYCDDQLKKRFIKLIKKEGIEDETW